MKKKVTIYTIRGYKVMLDEDLAKLYGVETRVLNQAIQRNKERFPEDFMFKLTNDEYTNLRLQIVTSRNNPDKAKPLNKHNSLISQIVISKWGGRRKMPFAFTEHGAVMLATVLRSKRAVQMSIEVVKAFVRLRRAVSSQKDMDYQLTEIRSYMLKQSNKTDHEFRKIWKALDGLTGSSGKESDPSIGFRVD